MGKKRMGDLAVNEKAYTPVNYPFVVTKKNPDGSILIEAERTGSDTVTPEEVEKAYGKGTTIDKVPMSKLKKDRPGLVSFEVTKKHKDGSADVKWREKGEELISGNDLNTMVKTR